MRSLIRRVAVLVAAPAAVLSAQQQPITLRVSPQTGQSARYRTDIESWLNLAQLVALGVDTTRPTTALTLYSTRTIVLVKADTAVIRDVVDSAVAAAPAVPGVNPTDAANAAASMRGVTTLTAVDGRGRMLDYAAGTQQTTRLDPPVQALLPAGGLLRAVFAFPAGPVRPGDTWSETLTGGDGDGSLTMSATFTFERTQTTGGTRIAVITMAGQIGGGGPNGALAMRATGRLEYDLTTSQPIRYVTDMNGQFATVNGSVPMRVRRTVVRL